MGKRVDRMMLRFHKPQGMSYSHFRCLIKQRVNFANRRARSVSQDNRTQDQEPDQIERSMK